jgi:putative endonuclease
LLKKIRPDGEGVTRRSVVPTADLSQGDKTTMEKFCVYFLKSVQNGDIYIGSSNDVTRRVARHNAGGVRSTKGYRPWKLIGVVECGTRSEAVTLESFYKTGQQRALLKKKYKAA